MPASARKAALRSALSAKLKAGKLLVLDRIELEAPKTKLLVKLLGDLQVTMHPDPHSGKGDDVLERAARNLPRVKVLRAEGANVYDLLRYDRLILTQGAVDCPEQRLGA